MSKITRKGTASVNDLIEALYAIRDSQTRDAPVYFALGGEQFRLTDVTYYSAQEDLDAYEQDGPFVHLTGPDD